VAALEAKEGELREGEPRPDALESEENGAPLGSLRARLRDRQAAKNRLKIEVADLEAKGQGLRQQMLDAVTAVDSYAKLPSIIDEAERLGARQELKSLLQTVIDGVEWRQDPKDPKLGEALIRLYELPAEFGLKRQKKPTARRTR
jgi:predicted  nucleic acid-binding Zn-ribbon protein